MPAVLTHKAILLLARDRLARIREATARSIGRKTVAGLPVSALETRINAMADAAFRMMGTGPVADVTQARARDSGFGGEPDLFGTGISRFAIMGCMGPDIPGFAQVFRPGQAWAFDTVHKGTPDYNREAVVARTMDLALGFHLQALIKVREKIQDADTALRDAKREAEMEKIRAYVLGHFCHLAGDIVAHPFINDLEWHLGIPGAKHTGHGKNEAVIDAAVARRVFRRASTREGQGWAAWWPEADDVPDHFHEAWAAAFQSTYGTERPKGFKDFEDDLARFGAPEMNADFMKSGYRTFRGLALTGGYDWGFGPWFGMLSLFAVPLMFSPLIAYALPDSRQFFHTPENPADRSGEREAYGLVSLPLQLGALGALVYGAVLLPFSAGTRGRVIAGIVIHALSLAALVTTGAVQAAGARIPPWVRWLFFFGPAATNTLVNTGFLISDATKGFKHPRPFNDEKPASRRVLLDIVNLVPFLFLAFFFVAILVYLAFGKILGGDSTGDVRDIDRPAFWLSFAITALGVLALWIGLPFKLRDQKIPEKVKDDAFSLQRHAVRLFDDTTLFADPTATGPVRELYYPSDIRPLARIWWQGAGKMEIRSDRFGLTFRPQGGTEQTIPGPLAPMTMAEYLTFLTETVKAADGTTGGLQGTVFDAEAIAAYLLPPGATFAALGDLDEDEEAEVAEESAKFTELDTAGSEKSFTLYHAPKPFQAVKAVPGGTLRAANETVLRAAETSGGYPYLLDPLTEDPATSPALLARAADLGALLCMGAANHMTSGPVAEDRVYQIFRNWSLDRRRVNEWRMIVEGGAESEKGSTPEAYDAAMPQGLLGPSFPERYTAPVARPADPTVLAEAESTARLHGWTGTLRDWLRALEEGEDLTSPAETRPGTPSNRALSRALAYMFDTADPAGGP